MKANSPLYLDSNIFLNVIYREAPLNEASGKLLEKVELGELQALTSAVTILEVKLVMARLGDWSAAGRAAAIIKDLKNLRIVPLNESTDDLAADHVVEDKITVHDAYHLATAVTEKAEIFVTRDEELGVKIRRYIKVMAPEEL